MAFLAALLALVLWELLRTLVARPWLRGVVAFLAAQSALLVGYALWGGVKEVAAALFVALVAALMSERIAPTQGDREGAARNSAISANPPGPNRKISLGAIVPTAIASAALLGVLSVGGAIWLIPPLGAAFATLLRRNTRQALRSAATFLALAALLCIPLFASGRLLPPTSSPLTDDDAKGNLVEALDPFQVAGIWPAGDFRIEPDSEPATYFLIAILIAMAVFGARHAWRTRAWAPLLYVGAAVLGFTVLSIVGSPWVAAKATAIASPAVLMIGLAGAAGLLGSTGATRVAGAVVLAVLGASVLWSNALAYHDARLAPRDQLAELERIGELIAGEGPALMTEYQPYGVRHFLREADPEGISELRRHPIPLRSGRTVEKGEWADTDRIELDELLRYRTLVLRRSPEQSRPPSPYARVFTGDYYEVWQRDEDVPVPTEHLPLGDGLDPGAVPSCTAVRALAEKAGGNGVLLAAPAPHLAVVEPGAAELPPAWVLAGSRGIVLAKPGTGSFPFDTTAEGEYEVWAAGSVQGSLEAIVDGRALGAEDHELNNSGLYVYLGTIELGRGTHELTLDYDENPLAPGSSGPSPSVGPLVLSSPAGDELVMVQAREADRLCGRRWDWIEALVPAGR